MGIAMRRRRQLRKLVNSFGRLKCANERLSSYRASAWWEYNECARWRSLSPGHAKQVEAGYVAGHQDVCFHDVRNSDLEWEYDFEYMHVTLITGRKCKGGWWWIRRIKILDSGPRR